MVPQVLSKYLNTDGKGSFIIKNSVEASLSSISLKNPLCTYLTMQMIGNGAGDPEGILCVYKKVAF